MTGETVACTACDAIVVHAEPGQPSRVLHEAACPEWLRLATR